MAICGVLRGPITHHWAMMMLTVVVMAVEPNYTGASPSSTLTTVISQLGNTAGKHRWETQLGRFDTEAKITQLSSIEADLTTGLFQTKPKVSVQAGCGGAHI